MKLSMGIRVINGIRQKTSLIPPNISSLKEIGKLQSKYEQAHPERFEKMAKFYKNVVKGDAPKIQPRSFGEWYHERYTEKNSPMPIIHIIVGTMCLGYYSSMFIFGVGFHVSNCYALTFHFSIIIQSANSINLLFPFDG